LYAEDTVTMKKLIGNVLPPDIDPNQNEQEITGILRRAGEEYFCRLYLKPKKDSEDESSSSEASDGSVNTRIRRLMAKDMADCD